MPRSRHSSPPPPPPTEPKMDIDKLAASAAYAIVAGVVAVLVSSVVSPTPTRITLAGLLTFGFLLYLGRQSILVWKGILTDKTNEYYVHTPIHMIVAHAIGVCVALALAYFLIVFTKEACFYYWDTIIYYLRNLRELAIRFMENFIQGYKDYVQAMHMNNPKGEPFKTSWNASVDFTAFSLIPMLTAFTILATFVYAIGASVYQHVILRIYYGFFGITNY